MYILSQNVLIFEKKLYIIDISNFKSEVKRNTMLKIARSGARKREDLALGVVLGVSLLVPYFMVTPASAGSVQQGAIRNATSTMTVSIEPSISLAAYDPTGTSQISAINFDDLDASGTLVSKAAKLRVSTNAAGGYNMTLSMSGATTDLVQQGASRQIVGTTTDNVTAVQMRQNMWGYSISDPTTPATMTYSKVPASTNPVTIRTRNTPTTSSSNPSAYEDTALTFGVKVDSAIASGTYSNTVVITAVAVDD